jgi:guanylate kinase
MHPPLIISGPSGIGKTYLEKHLIKNHNFKRIMSTTTRPAREGEQNWIDYHFVTEDEYKKIEKENGFITSSHHLAAHYGFEKNLVEQIQQENKIPITIVVPTVVEPFIKVYPQTFAIYLKPYNDELQIKRMKLRGDSDDKIAQRLEAEKSQHEHFEKIKHMYHRIFTVNEENFEEMLNEIHSFYT